MQTRPSFCARIGPARGRAIRGLRAGVLLPLLYFYLAPAVLLAATDVTSPGDLIVGTSSNTPGSEGAANAIDNQPTKYLNFDRVNTGFTVTPGVGATVVTGLTLTSANDAPERDPASYILSGANGGTNFTLISTGAVPVFPSRFSTNTILFSNAVPYLTYRLIFPVTAGPSACCMQIAEVELLGGPPPPPVLTIMDGPTQDRVVVTVTAAPGQFFNVQYSPDVFNWINLGSGTTDVTGTYRVTNQFFGGLRHYRAAIGNVYSVNVVSAINVNVPSGGSFLANQLYAPDQRVSAVLANAPDGISIFRPNGAGYQSANRLGAWSNPNVTLVPGEGFFVSNPFATNITLRFLGELPVGSLKNCLPAGLSLPSSIVPQAGLLTTALGYPAADGDQVYIYNSVLAAYEAYYYDAGFGGWAPNEPSVQVGQSFWSLKSASANWTRNFFPAAEGGPCNAAPPNLVAGLGQLNFFNWNPNTNFGRVRDLDGTTLLGPQFLGQLYAATGTNALVALGSPVAFGSGAGAGFVAGGVVSIPGTVPGNNVSVRLRAWEAAQGATYEAAQASGGKLGQSSVVVLTTGGGASASPGPIPPNANTFGSFNLTQTASVPSIVVNGQSQFGTNLAVSGAATVSFQSNFPNAHIFYTLDGSAPGGGVLFTGPFVLNASATVRAIAYDSNFTQSVESQPLTITISAPPVITSQPQSQATVIGQPVLFSVMASGSAPLAYQWQFNGVNRSGATNASLLLPSVFPGDAGSYRVRVANGFGAVTSSVAALTLFSQPAITSQPTNVLVAVGGGATFCVVVSGVPAPAYQWRKNGVFIPGATNSCLTIANVQLADAGSYSVTVANAAGAATSIPAELAIDGIATGPPAEDFFANRFSLNATGELTVNNIGATKEAGEPNHAGKPGGASIWYKWTAAASGIATVRTIGSSFDTLLAVYTGASVGNLTLVAADEDGGGSLTSAVRFNTTNGGTYQIAIDGFAAAQGSFILSWTVEPTPEIIPRILTQPASIATAAGGNATFSVVAAPTGLSYQWYFNSGLITNATNSTFTRTNAQLQHIGVYTVRMRLGTNRVVESAPANLEIGPVASVISYDKLEDLLNAPPPPEFGGGGASGGIAPAASAPAGGYISVNLGSFNGQALGTTNSGAQAGEPNHCSVLGNGRTRWFGLRAVTNGSVVLDTFGSTINTVMAIYRWTNYDNLLGNQVACDIDTASFASRAEFAVPRVTVQRPFDYLVAVDTIGPAVPTMNPDGSMNVAGLIRLNWQLGLLPVITNVTPDQLVPVGTPLTLAVNAGNLIAPAVTNRLAPPKFQWTLRGQPLLNATNPSLPFTSISLLDAGDYSVIVSNAFGATSAIVRVAVLDAVVRMPTVGTDESATLGVAVAGDAGCLPSYQWFHNGVPLGGKTGPTLSLTDATLASAGQYTVVITTCGGMVTVPVATVAVEATLAFGLGPWARFGSFEFPPVTTPASGVVLERASGLPAAPDDWLPIFTNRSLVVPLQFPLPPGETSQPGRYYRARLLFGP